MRWVLHAKIHQAVVTEANLDYVGSISIDAALIDRAGLWPGEKVMVVSNTTGARLQTYVIVAPSDSGTIGMNGAAAHMIRPGEEIIIMGFVLTDAPVEAKLILVDENNTFVRYL